MFVFLRGIVDTGNNVDVQCCQVKGFLFCMRRLGDKTVCV